MKFNCLISAVGLAALASCQSMSSGVITLEARAIVLDDADIDLDSELDVDDIDVEGYGIHAALMTPIVDLLAGVEERKYDSEDAPELVLGARRRLLEFWRLHPFVEGNVRYGFNLDNGETSEDYFGYQLGIGAILDLTDHLFINFRLMYDTTSVDVAGGSSADIDSTVGTIGLGFNF